ncbi:hypothetical protein ACLBV5_06975, partial [Brevundimonas sp. M1A4_2e]
TAAQAALLPTQPISTQINLGLLLWLDEKRGSRHRPPEKTKFTVFDGNRRVTCLKLLDDPRRAPTT